MRPTFNRPRRDPGALPLLGLDAIPVVRTRPAVQMPPAARGAR